MTEYSVELVITVPEQYGMLLAYQTKCRTTIGVLAQLLAQAKHRVIISAPFIQPDQGLAEGVLADALQSSLQRGVNVDVVSTGRGLHAIDRERLLQKSVGKLQFFQPSANLIDKHKLGSHAKFCVADGTSAYVGSANLTSPGLSGQLEMGLLVCGEVAGQIEQFLDYAVELGLFVIVS
jgi:phosphatidylserine/phosphatidylglycerophosphate/cardiolipin synthase-like enzyme